MFTVIRISVEQEAMVQNIVHHLKPQKSVIFRGIGVDELVQDFPHLQRVNLLSEGSLSLKPVRSLVGRA